MRDGRAGQGHPPWRGGEGLAMVEQKGFFRDLNALRLDASANSYFAPYCCMRDPVRR